MTNLLTRPRSTAAPDDDPRSPLMRRADRWMFTGIVLAGSWVFGPVGFPFLVVAAVLMNRAQKRGELTRPWAVTIIGTLTLIDSCVNYFAWGADFLFSHDTALVQTVWSGYGKLVDGAYYIDYNSTSLGGFANMSEKCFQVIGLGAMYPIRMVGALLFLRMKRLGLQLMIVSSFIYVAFWMAYVFQLFLAFNARMGASVYGAIGWWVFVLPYAGAFVMLPYLYTVDRELFSE